MQNRSALILMLALAGALSLAAQQPAPQDVVYLFQHPQAVPALQTTSLSGGSINLASLRGKVVLLNFWATWCGPCREEIPALERIQSEYAGRVQVIGMSVDDAISPAEVAQKAAAMKINYPVAMATNTIQTRFGGMSTIPVTWVIDKNGQVDQRNHGANPYEVFDTEVRALLGLPTTIKVARVDQLSPDGKVGTADIPGIAAELKSLTPAQRQKVLTALNGTACTCGCEWSLATCRVKDPGCGFSLPQAKAMIAALTGKR